VNSCEKRRKGERKKGRRFVFCNFKFGISDLNLQKEISLSPLLPFSSSYLL